MLIKSVAQPPLTKQQDQLLVQKAISIIEQKQQRYLTASENRSLIAFLASCPLIKHMQNKHLVAKLLIQHGKYIRLEKDEELNDICFQSNIIFAIKGVLEDTNSKSYKNTDLSSMQSTLNSQLTQQMSFSEVYNLIESGTTLPYSNDITHVVSQIQCINSLRLSNDNSNNPQQKMKRNCIPKIFTLNKPFTYHGIKRDINGSIPNGNVNYKLKAQSQCNLLVLDLKYFIANFDIFLEQIVFVTHCLQQSQLNTISSPQTSIISQRFREQYILNKATLDLNKDIVIIKQGSLAIYKNGIMITMGPGQSVGLEYDQSILNIVSTSIPLICYTLEKISFQQLYSPNQVAQLAGTEKEQIACNNQKVLRSMETSRNNSLLLNHPRLVNKAAFIDSNKTFHTNSNLLSNNIKAKNYNRKQLVKRNSLIVESQNSKDTSQQSQQQESNNYVQINICQSKQPQINTKIIQSQSLNMEDQQINTLLMNSFLIEEEQQNAKLNFRITQKRPHTPSRIKNYQVVDPQAMDYNFVKRSQKSNYCVKDSLMYEQQQMSPKYYNQIRMEQDSNSRDQQTFNFISPLKDSILFEQRMNKNRSSSSYEEAYQNYDISQQLGILDTIKIDSLNNIPIKTEVSRLGKSSDRVSLQSQSQQQQNIFTVTSYRQKSNYKNQNYRLKSADPAQRSSKDGQHPFRNRQGIYEENIFKNRYINSNQFLKTDQKSLFNFQHFVYENLCKGETPNYSHRHDQNQVYNQINDTISTQDGDKNDQDDFIQLKQKYQFEQDKNISGSYPNKHQKPLEQRQPRLKKKMNEYNEIQQEIQWETMKTKLIKDIMNKKFENNEEGIDTQEIKSNRNEAKSQKQHQLNNSNDSSPVNELGNQNLLQSFYYQDQQEFQESGKPNTLHINSLQLDYSPLQSSRFYQKQFIQNKLLNSSINTQQQQLNMTSYQNFNKLANKFMKSEKSVHQQSNSQPQHNNHLNHEQSSVIKSNKNSINVSKIFIKNTDISQNPSILVKNTINLSRKKKILISRKQCDNNTNNFDSLSAVDFKLTS